MKRTLTGLLIMVVLLAAVPVFAGGWAVVSLDELPADIHAGEPTEFHFMVRQHGEKPVHYYFEDDSSPVEPMLTATNLDTGETVEAKAVPGKEVGRFSLEVTFPSEGSWEWTIRPFPFEGEGVFPPLTVLAPLAAGTAVQESKQQPVAEPALIVPSAEDTAIEQTAPAAPIEVAPAVEGSAVSTAATSTISSAEPALRSGLQWAAIALLVVAIALLLVQRRGASASRLGTEGSGD